MEQWRVLQACVTANVIVIMQAANTGLTGGSTPAADGYDREVVIISTRRIAGVFLIQNGGQVVCLPGSTLHELERRLLPLGREPHSVIGSTCIGASVIGGVCNNSGGALTRRGPAFTRFALFARVDATGQLQLINHLGIELGQEPEEMLQRLEAGRFGLEDVTHVDQVNGGLDYASHVRDIEADTPARFNADPRTMFESSGSAGKVVIFAVRLDTHPLESRAVVFYVGTRSCPHLATLRRTILKDSTSLPISAEYLHRDAYALARDYGKDQFLLIEKLGTARLPQFFELKSRCEALLERLRAPANLTDRLLQRIGQLYPDHLPPRLEDYHQRFEHHLLLRVSKDSSAQMRDLLDNWSDGIHDSYFECSESEARKAFLHRFVVAGAAVRYRAVHPAQVENIVALDVALRRNDTEWFEILPPDIESRLLRKIYYGHFLCHVFHQDYLVMKGADCLALEHQLWRLLQRRGARYPAEHNVGHLYPAAPELQDFYRQLDPGNRFNAGIGQMSLLRDYAPSTSTESATS